MTLAIQTYPALGAPPWPAFGARHYAVRRPAVAQGSVMRADAGVRPTDQEFAAAIAAIALSQDRRAFACLFEFFAPRVKGFLIRRGTLPEIAEELAQETMLILWRKANSFDSCRAGASTWIFTIARNLRIDHIRRERRAAMRSEKDAAEDVTQPDLPDAQLTGFQDLGQLRAAVADLSPDQARVIELSFIDGLAHPDIALRLGLPLGTVKSRARLGLARLRHVLDGLR